MNVTLGGPSKKRVLSALQSSSRPKFAVEHAVGYEETIEQCKKSLELLDTEYIDLYLVHAPPLDPEHRAPVWKAMEYCLEQGWVKSIGVSNYGVAHLDAMKEYANYMPSVNQVEYNPLAYNDLISSKPQKTQGLD